MNNLGFGFEFNDKYLVVVNGREVKESFDNRKSALRYAIRCSRNLDLCVELYYQHSNGICVLVNF